VGVFNQAGFNMSLKDKVALVTGANVGIGRATAVRLASEGARVALVGRRSDLLEEVAREIESAGGVAVPMPCDITDESAVRKLVQDVSARLGGIDLLVNNAGLMLLGRFDKGLSDEWRRMNTLNVQALAYLCHAVIAPMTARGGGIIVNVSSTAGRRGRLMNGFYAGTKAAVLAISESLRLELMSLGIRVCVVIPGAVSDTELQSHVSDPDAKAALEGLRGMTLLQPDDVAAAIAFVADQPPHVSVSELLIRPTQQEF
jgi:NADP-dependent 3-hydroxy acid dehydrogenase YdfG